MPIITIAHLRAAGLSAPQIVAILEQEENERLARRREQNRIAQRNHRARQQCHADVADIADEQKKGFPHLPKENTSPSEPKKVPQEKYALHRVCEILRGLGPQPDNAKILHDAVEAALRAENFDVVREFSINLGGECGLIDLVVRPDTGPCIAIELDRRLPRAKSLQKLAAFDGFRIAVTRTFAPNPEFERIVDAVIAVPPIQIQKNPRPPSHIAAFDQFWAVYPKHVGKPRALKSFQTAMGKTSIEAILAALQWQIETWRDPEFIPYPATWLNQERWNDERTLFNGNGNGNGRKHETIIDRGRRLYDLAVEIERNKAAGRAAVDVGRDRFGDDFGGALSNRRQSG